MCCSCRLGIAGFYTDYLWFDALGQSDVLPGILGAKLGLAAIFTGFAPLLALNLWIADASPAAAAGAR